MVENLESLKSAPAADNTASHHIAADNQSGSGDLRSASSNDTLVQNKALPDLTLTDVTVKDGDNLWKIAREALKQDHADGSKPTDKEVLKAVQAIEKENHLANPDRIHAGDHIHIPDAIHENGQSSTHEGEQAQTQERQQSQTSEQRQMQIPEQHASQIFDQSQSPISGHRQRMTPEEASALIEEQRRRLTPEQRRVFDDEQRQVDAYADRMGLDTEQTTYRASEPAPQVMRVPLEPAQYRQDRSEQSPPDDTEVQHSTGHFQMHASYKNASRGFVTEARNDFETLPENVRRLVADSGNKIVLSGKISDLDLSGPNSGGRPAASTAADKYESRYDARNKQIIVAENYYDAQKGQYVKNTHLDRDLKHEVGHAVDDALGGMSRTDDFRNAVDRDVAQMSPANQERFNRDLANGGKTYEEVFADLFRSEYEGNGDPNRSREFQRNYPSASAQIRERLSRLPAGF